MLREDKRGSRGHFPVPSLIISSARHFVFVCLWLVCVCSNHYTLWIGVNKKKKTKKTSGSIQDAWNSSPAWFRLLPEPPCLLRRRADKVCCSTQCLDYLTQNYTGVWGTRPHDGQRWGQVYRTGKTSREKPGAYLCNLLSAIQYVDWLLREGHV